ncbi:MAG: N-acetyltransferase [Pirellulaceae bacterium]|nr:N-acetyltransferase [Pirellulaceae bacterium]
MESSLLGVDDLHSKLPDGVRLLSWSSALVRDHAHVKYESFRNEIDANVFPCLARKDGCLQLMKDLSRRKDFVAEATWLAVYRTASSEKWVPIGTIQGLRTDKSSGAIQNLGIIPAFRSLGLGSILLGKSLAGFALLGCLNVSLEVTVQNSAAIRLYERLGFRRVETVFKIAEVLVS